MSTERELSFKLIDEWVEGYSKTVDKSERPSQTERWAFVVAMLGPGVFFPLGMLIAGSAGMVLVQLGLAIELAALAFWLFLFWRRERKNFSRANGTYALELDRDYLQFREFVARLRKFPGQELKRKHRYIEARRMSLTYRMGLLTGGMERLGVVPVIVVLYLQFKDWSFGDWTAFEKVNLLGGMLLWALLLFYLISWWSVKLKVRVDAYEMLLKEAIAEDV